MKKTLSILCCVILFAATSCTKKYITPNPNETVFATVNTTDWTLYSDGKSYDAPVKIDDLTDATALAGVIVSMSYDGSTYEQIPEVYNGTSFSFTYSAGNLTLYAQSPDGNTPIQPTLPVKVKITLVAGN